MTESSVTHKLLTSARHAVSIILLTMLTASAWAGGYTYRPGQGMSCAWHADDHVGVYTTAGSRMNYSVVATDMLDYGTATLSCGWALTPNTLYYSYAPYQSNYFDTPITSLPISYTGQQQTENGSTAHLAAYDFMAATCTTGDDNAHFTYSHLGCILRIELPIGQTATYTSLTLTTPSSSDALFVSDATMNLTTLTTTPKARQQSLTLQLSDIALSSGENLVAYLMLAPTDLTGHVLHVTATAADGITTEMDITGASMTAGKIYTTATTGSSSKAAATKRQKASSQIATIKCTMPDFTEETLHAVVTAISDTRVATESKSRRYEIIPGKIYIQDGRKYLIRKR